MICLVLVIALIVGTGVFGYRFVKYGSDWATFYGNTQIYTDGAINRGTITDRNGVELLTCTPDGFIYTDDYEIRVSTVHAVGDPGGNVSTGAIAVFRSELIGYDILNGIYDTDASGKRISLTIDANANRAAYEALAGRTGAVGVYNWKTGEIVCMVSTPTFDPANDDGSSDGEGAYYFNNFFSGLMTPGSTFKLVTAAAVIDNVPDRNAFTFDCDGVNQLGDRDDSKLIDVRAHGEVDFRGALAQSCNGAFGALTRRVGAEVMREYVDKVGLTSSIDVDGIETAAGSFDFPDDNDVKLGWAGIGQAEDLVNPCAMMVYMGAIANGGEAIKPTMIKSASFLKEITGGKSLGRYLDEDTAAELRSMMKNNVIENYGEENFAGMDMYAKSGTAESGSYQPDAWFVGFTDDEDAPYAFVVWVKGGGSGADVAAPIAARVIRSLQGYGE